MRSANQFLTFNCAPESNTTESMSERTQPRQPERRALPARASTFRFGTGTRATLEPRRLRSSAQNRMLLARSSPFGNRQLLLAQSYLSAQFEADRYKTQLIPRAARAY